MLDDDVLVLALCQSVPLLLLSVTVRTCKVLLYDIYFAENAVSLVDLLVFFCCLSADNLF